MSLHHPLHRHCVLCASCLDNRGQLLMALPVLTEPLIQVPGLNPNSSRSCSWSYHSSRLRRGCRPHLLFPGKLHSEASLLLASRCQVTRDIPTSRTAPEWDPLHPSLTCPDPAGPLHSSQTQGPALAHTDLLLSSIYLPSTPFAT